jgi:hypothetical protein
MSIDRHELVRRHNPVHHAFDPFSPLSVGNGEFAFTADITGLQSFFPTMEGATPLCTMAQWGFHSYPETEGVARNPDLLRRSYFNAENGTGGYMTDPAGQEELFRDLRINPHRLNLGRIAFLFGGKELSAQCVAGIEQVLDLWSGELRSTFLYKEQQVEVLTLCHPNEDILGIHIRSPLLAHDSLSVQLSFPYGSHEMDASDWQAEDRHATRILRQAQRTCVSLLRVLDDDRYYVDAATHGGERSRIAQTGRHAFEFATSGLSLEIVIRFSPYEIKEDLPSFYEIQNAAHQFWEAFWSSGGAVELAESRDKRAIELERRIVLSRYLTAIQCAGSYPPAETGLTCNSWYGKFHLEMHYWHAVHFIMWGKPEFFERSFGWYRRILESARQRAAEQGYEGARWPKMTDPSGRDSPSPIGPLLCWQQPHPIMYAELLRRAHPERPILSEYADIVTATADFMASFAQWNETKKRYELGPPLIPVQENHRPEETRNPPYELEYWRWGLSTAIRWLGMLDRPVPQEWIQVAANLAPLPLDSRRNIYLAHEACPATYEEYATDHPAMLFPLGVLPGASVNREYMSQTFDAVLRAWDLQSLWGWDFPAMAMTAARLGRTRDAVDLLLMETPKNTYRPNGHNPQLPRTDLPVYLPGNGSLLLAIALMTGGWGERTEAAANQAGPPERPAPTASRASGGAPVRACAYAPGFPDDGSWTVQVEDICPIP